MSIERVAVLGGGAWGTALAQACAHAGRAVTLWEHEPGNAESLLKKRESRFLPGVKIDDRIAVTTDLKNAAKAQAILMVVPAQVLRSVTKALAPALAKGTPVIVCAKGIEHGTQKFMTEIVAECAPDAIPAILSGPSFAADVARGMPTAVTLAAKDAKIAAELSLAIGSTTFRPYHATDVRGVEIGGAMKNVLAIAAGIAAGQGLGASASAALITRGFGEIVRFGNAYGAKTETMMGLSGLGDLILTASSPQSRNFSFGQALGKGAPIAQASGGKLAEGAFTAPVLLEMAAARNIDMPIHSAIAAVLSGKSSVDDAIKSLLARPFGVEE